MTNTTASEVQFEHKQWLHDIDRWSFYLQSWRSQAQELVREYRRLQKMVEQYAEDLDDFGDEMGAFEQAAGELTRPDRTPPASCPR